VVGYRFTGHEYAELSAEGFEVDAVRNISYRIGILIKVPKRRRFSHSAFSPVLTVGRQSQIYSFDQYGCANLLAAALFSFIKASSQFAYGKSSYLYSDSLDGRYGTPRR
jgi:hypothetical protein